MGNILYLECYSGISGDMTVATLIDLGADKNVLEKALKSLPLEGFEIKISRVKKSGLDMCDFNVILDENHDHDMNYLHGQENNLHSSNKDNINKDESYHNHRGILEIFDVINKADITDKAKELSKNIFEVIVKAESKAHGVDIKDVHFHEVGAVDSIVDIVAVAVCLDNLKITEVIVEELYEGRGFIRCQHGIIPIPVPAVTNIVCDNNLQLHITNTEGELVTPTGAAIVAAIMTSNKLPEKFSIEKVGIGAGKRNYERPSMLRGMIIKKNCCEKDYIYKLESNIDDCSGEVLGFAMERLFEAGARDVHYTPIYMKKNRPAYTLNVICSEDNIEKLEQIIFEETTTIGIRKVKMERSILSREVKIIRTSLGEAQVKECKFENRKKIYPEYSSVIELCKKHKMSYEEVYNLIQRECE